MWFYVPAVILLVLFGWWVSRTNVFRHYRNGDTKDPGQRGVNPGGWNENGGSGI